MRVHSELGCGLKEHNYQDAVEIELIEAGIPFVREKCFFVTYKGQQLARPYKADFVIFDSIILELKATPKIIDHYVAQALSYLTVASLKLAIIVNFGEKSLTNKRVVM